MNTETIDTKLTQREAAILLGVSKQTLISWANRGWLAKPERRGGRVLYSVEQLRADIQKNRLRCNQF